MKGYDAIQAAPERSRPAKARIDPYLVVTVQFCLIALLVISGSWGAHRAIQPVLKQALTLKWRAGALFAGQRTGSFAILAAIRCVEALDFIRKDFGNERARLSFSPHSAEGTDPGFDGATAEKGHLKHCAVIRWRTGLEFTSSRLAAAL